MKYTGKSLIHTLFQNIQKYCYVEIRDKYDFPKEADYGAGMTNTLNSLGYYYQINLKGNVYELKFKLIDNIE